MPLSEIVTPCYFLIYYFGELFPRLCPLACTVKKIFRTALNLRWYAYEWINPDSCNILWKCLFPFSFLDHFNNSMFLDPDSTQKPFELVHNYSFLIISNISLKRKVCSFSLFIYIILICLNSFNMSLLT